MLFNGLCQIDWRTVYKGQFAIYHRRADAARDRSKHKGKSLHGLKMLEDTIVARRPRRVTANLLSTRRVSGTVKKRYYFYCQGPVGAKFEIHNRVKVAPSKTPTNSRPNIATMFHIVTFGLASPFSERFI